MRRVFGDYRRVYSRLTGDAMPRDHERSERQRQQLTRNQILQYVAEMSEEMSQLASKAECAGLAHSLRNASSQARGLLPGDARE
jgi:hypothetical protein